MILLHLINNLEVLCGIVIFIVLVIYWNSQTFKDKINNMIVDNTISIALLFMLLGFTVIITSLFSLPFNDYSGNRDSDLFAKFGDYIGGFVGTIFSFAGFFMIFRTFSEQRKQYSLDKFDSRFYELLNIHKQNVSEMSIKSVDHGQKVFIDFFYEYRIAYNILKQNHLLKIPYKDLHAIAYYIFYFGIGSKSAENSLEIFLNIRLKNKEMVKEIISYMRFKKIYIKEKHAASDNKESLKYRLFDGHMSVLTHYYKHLFLMVSYIDKSIHIDDNQKKEYASIIRAQLSEYELFMFYFYIQTVLGREWLFKNKCKLEKQNIDDNSFVIKYNLLKHLLYPYIIGFGISPLSLFDKYISKAKQNGKYFFKWDEFKDSVSDQV